MFRNAGSGWPLNVVEAWRAHVDQADVAVDGQPGDPADQATGAITATLAR